MSSYQNPQTQSVTPAANAGYNGNLSVILDGELMQNYRASLPVTPGHYILAAQDQNGDPMLFSISSDNRLWMIRRDPSQSLGWSQFAISDAFGDGTTVNAFTVNQSSAGEVFLAMDIAGSGAWVSKALPNDPLDDTWQNLTEQGVLRGYPSGISGVALDGLQIGNVDGQPLLVLAELPSGSEINRYFVNGDSSDSSWDWKSYSLPENADSIIDVALGVNRNGPGSYCLYQVGTNLALTFTTIPIDIYGNGSYYETFDSPLTVPQDATQIEAVPDPNNYNYSHLFVGGDELYWYSSTRINQDYKDYDTTGDGPAPETILSLAAPIRELQVRQDTGTIAIWWADQVENLYYLRGNQGSSNAEADWGEALVLRSQVVQIAALRNQPRQTNEVFFVTGASELGYLTQDSNTSVWREQDIPLQSYGDLQTINTFTSQVKFFDDQGSPMPDKTLQITASEWTYTWVNGNLYALDSEHPVEVQTDSTGTVCFLMPVNKPTTPIYRIDADFLGETVLLNPGQKVQNGMAGVQTGDDLKNATNQDGTPVIENPDDYSDDAYDAGAWSLQQMSGIMDQLPADGSTYSGTPTTEMLAEPWGISRTAQGVQLYKGQAVAQELLPSWGHARTQTLDLGVVSWVEGVAGDVMDTIENAWDEVKGFFIQVAEDAFHFFVQLGETLIRIAIETLAIALEIACWVLDFLFNIDLAKILKWLGFLFSWDDIQTTHNVLANMGKQTLDMVTAEFPKLKKEVVRWFTSLKLQLKEIEGKIPQSVLDQTQQAVQSSTEDNLDDTGDSSMQFAFNSASGNMAAYQLQYGGVTNVNLPDDSANLGPIETFVEDLLVPLLKQAAELIQTLLQDLISGIQGFLNGTKTIGDIISLIVTDTLDSLISIMEVLVLGMLSEVESVIQTFEKVATVNIDIPLLTPLYEWISGSDELTLLDGMCLLAAIPVTMFYKLMSGEAPFADGTNGWDTDSWQEIFGSLSGNTGGGANSFLVRPPLNLEEESNTHGQLLYSWIGGASVNVTTFIASIMDGINALAKDEIKILTYIECCFDVANLCMSFPVTKDKTNFDLEAAEWGINTIDLLINVIMAMMPRSAEEEANTLIAGPYKVLSGLVKLGLDTACLAYNCNHTDDSEELAWLAEAYVQDIADTFAQGLQAAGNFDPDPETESILEIGAALESLIACLLGGCRDYHCIKEEILFEF